MIPERISDRSLERGASWLTLSTALVGVVNYCYAMSLTWLLPAHSYSNFVSGQALLLLCTTVAGASVPWVIAQGIVRAGDAQGRRGLLKFAFRMASGQGIVAALMVVFVAAQFATRMAQVTLATTAGTFFLSAIAVGYLQGKERFGVIAGLRFGEVVAKVAVGIPLSRTAMGAAGALAGFAAGALVVSIGGLPFLRRDLRGRPRPYRYRGPWRQATWLTALQAGVALFANMDILLASVVKGPSLELARYQASAIVGRIPLFLALALAAVIFPRLSAARSSPAAVLQTASEFFLRTTVPVALIIATMPRSLVDRVLPAEYSGTSTLLPYTATSGVAISVIYLLVTAYQAEQRFRTGARLLAAALGIQGGAVAVGLSVGGVDGLPGGALAGSVGSVIVALTCSARVWPRGFRPRWATALSIAPAGLLVAFERDLLAWTTCAVIVLAGAGWALIQPHVVGRTASTLSGVDHPSGDARDLC
jgi:O-antigen/teichoic acid export membrane protein